MKTVLTIFFSVLLPIVSYGEEVPFLACDRPVIRQAIELSRQVTARTPMGFTPQQKTNRLPLIYDQHVVDVIEKKIFGKKVFSLTYDILPGASISVNENMNMISIYPDTIESLNQLSPEPLGAHAFIIAHEIAHMVQAHWKKFSQNKLSPMGLTYEHASDSDGFNLLHAETDCIGLELMHMAGLKDMSLAIPALQLTTEICKPMKKPGVCERAELIRLQSIHSYLSLLK